MIRLLDILKEQLLQEYDQTTIDKITLKFRREKAAPIDIPPAIQEFERIKSNIAAKLEGWFAAGQQRLPEKFTTAGKYPITHKQYMQMEKDIKGISPKILSKIEQDLQSDNPKIVANAQKQKENIEKSAPAALSAKEAAEALKQNIIDANKGEKFDPPLDPQDIFNYTWPELEQLFDAYGGKKTQTVKTKDAYTVQDEIPAELLGLDKSKVYNGGNGIVVYEASTGPDCIKLNYLYKYKDEDNKTYTYTFCIGREESGANRYFNYRFGEKSKMYRSFYFVADTTQSPGIKGDPTNKNNFTNWYHFFIIHVFEPFNKGEEPRYGVTDATNEYFPTNTHEFTGKDGEGATWNEIGNFMTSKGGKSGQEAWDKIKGLKSVFKYVGPNEEETADYITTHKPLDFNRFKDLKPGLQNKYIQKWATNPNAFTSEMFDSLGSEIELKTIAMNSGYTPTYDQLAQLKTKEGKPIRSLPRTYAVRTFKRNLSDFEKNMENPSFRKNEMRALQSLKPLPLPFVEYLTDEEKTKYADLLKDFLTPDLMNKYFGKEVAENYANAQAKNLDFLSPDGEKYITDSDAKTIFDAYKNLFANWELKEKSQNIEDKMASLTSMPGQEIDPYPMSYSQWIKLSQSDRKAILDLVDKTNGNPKYRTFLYAAPFVVENKGKRYALLPADVMTQSRAKSAEDRSKIGIYKTWVLVDENNEVILDNIFDSSTIKGYPLRTGYWEQPAVNDPVRVYNANEVIVQDSRGTKTPLNKLLGGNIAENQIRRMQKLAGIYD